MNYVLQYLYSYPLENRGKMSINLKYSQKRYIQRNRYL